MIKLTLAAALAAAATLAVPASAVTQIYTAPVATPGNQAWGGTLGLDFTVNSRIVVTSLSTFDSGKDGITSNILVGIFDLSTGSLVAPAVNFNGTANSSGSAYVLQSIAPIALVAGNYQLAAWGYNLGADINYNNMGNNPGLVSFASLGGALTAIGTRYSDFNAPGILATLGDVGATRYGAGTFSAAIPEPATWSLLIAGFAMTGFAMRRRAAVTIAA